MNKIFNWTIGSFFRTIGRTIAFLVMGGLVYYLLSHNGIDIKNLFLEDVKAATITQDVIKKETTIVTQDDNYSSWVDTWGKYRIQFNQSWDIQYSMIQFVQDGGILADRDYVEIPFSISQPLDSTQSWGTQDDFVVCRTYTCDNYNQQTGVCSQWKCLNWYTSGTSTAQTAVDHNTSLTQFNFFWTMVMTDNTTKGCTIQNNTIVCPLDKKKPKALRLYVNFPASFSTQTTIYIDRNFTYYNYSDVQGAIQNQTQQQQQQHQEIMDTNSTQTESSANDLFNNSIFEEQQGGLSSIITAPLVMINQMLSNTCVSPSATWKGQTISLPCGSMLWDRPNASQLKDLLNVFYGGFICYYAIRKLFLMIEKMKDPTSDNIEVTDL